MGTLTFISEILLPFMNINLILTKRLSHLYLFYGIVTSWKSLQQTLINSSVYSVVYCTYTSLLVNLTIMQILIFLTICSIAFGHFQEHYHHVSRTCRWPYNIL